MCFGYDFCGEWEGWEGSREGTNREVQVEGRAERGDKMRATGFMNHELNE